jgi:hypothetical protein
MNKPVILLLLLAVMPFLFSEKLKEEDVGVYVMRTTSLFATGVSDFDNLRFANIWAVYLGEHGKKEDWLTLKKGTGKAVYRDRNGGFDGAFDVSLEWQYGLDPEHRVVDYGWEWVGGSSSHSEIVQVLELRDHKVFITQQIQVDTHHSGGTAGAWFNPNKKLLVVKAVAYAGSEGRCCPSLMDIVNFRWDGEQFHRVGRKRVPLPKED